MKHSLTDCIRPYEKSVVLGGVRVLFPVEPALTNAFARQIKMTVKEAEERAYRQGYDDARKAIRNALGII